MSSPADPHDPRFDVEREEQLVLLAMGEPTPAQFTEHARACAVCRQELADYRYTVELAREAADDRELATAVPPPSVWTRIEAEIAGTEPVDVDVPSRSSGSYPPSDQPPARTQPGVDRPRRSWIRPTLLLAAAVLVLLGGVGGFLVGRSTSTSGAAPHAMSASLAPQPGGPAAAGSATIRASGANAQLTVTTRGLPPSAGYYEVWLFDPRANNMVAVGALGADGAGSYTLPAGIDLTGYHVVDISAQQYRGGSVITHANSVLRGQLN